jgi:hypothetical protein
MLEFKPMFSAFKQGAIFIVPPLLWQRTLAFAVSFKGQARDAGDFSQHGSQMAYITNSHQSHKSCRKYKSENGQTRTFRYTRGLIRCRGGVSIPCRLVTPIVNPIARSGKNSRNQCQEQAKNWHETHQTAFSLMEGCTAKLDLSKRTKAHHKPCMVKHLLWYEQVNTVLMAQNLFWYNAFFQFHKRFFILCTFSRLFILWLLNTLFFVDYPLTCYRAYSGCDWSTVGMLTPPQHLIPPLTSIFRSLCLPISDLRMCRLTPDLSKVRTFASHFLKDSSKLFPWDG